MDVWRGVGRAKTPSLYVLVGMCLGAAISAVPAVATPGAATFGDDLAVVSLHASVTHASRGASVTFTEVIHNNGTTTVEMDTPAPKITCGSLVNVLCDRGISTDSPNCEYGLLAPGTNRTTKFVVKMSMVSRT